MTDITIAVCTYRSDSLRHTLASLMLVDLPSGMTAEILVIDNDETPRARDVVEHFARSAACGLRYVHAPAGNISLARNAALDAASGRYIAFIDDDEVATVNWLLALMRVHLSEPADIVLGPVSAVYGDDAPPWMKEAELHSTAPVWGRGEIRSGYSGNVLIDRNSPAVSDLRFDLALGKCGGEDTLFFGTAHKAGARIGFAPDALVTEAVPQVRTTMRWLTARRLRSGRTHARILLEVENCARWRSIPVAAAKVAFCACQTAIFMPLAGRRNLAALRCIFHAGVVAGLIGKPLGADRRMSGEAG